MGGRSGLLGRAWIDGTVAFGAAGIGASGFYVGSESFSWPAFFIGGLAVKGLFAIVGPFIREPKPTQWSGKDTLDWSVPSADYEEMRSQNARKAPKPPGDEPE